MPAKEYDRKSINDYESIARLGSEFVPLIDPNYEMPFDFVNNHDSNLSMQRITFLILTCDCQRNQRLFCRQASYTRKNYRGFILKLEIYEMFEMLFGSLV